MIIRLLLAALAVLAPSQAPARDFCLQPLSGSEAQLDVEREDPYRIAVDPRMIPGFQGLIVRAQQRHELYEIDGQQFRRLDGDFPHVWGLADRHGIHVRADGSAFGFGSKPRAIFRLMDAQLGWRSLDETRGYLGALFDHGNGEVFVRMSSGAPYRKLVGGRLADAEAFPPSTLSVRTVPEIGGTLSLTRSDSIADLQSEMLWFRPRGGEWSRVGISFGKNERLFNDLRRIRLELDEGTLRIFPDSRRFEPLFFFLEGESLRFAGTAPRGEWEYHEASKSWIGWGGDVSHPTRETRFLFFDVPVEPSPPQFYVLREGAAKPETISGLTPPGKVGPNTAFYFPKIWIMEGLMPAILRTSKGHSAFDGTTVRALEGLTPDLVGDLPDIKRVGDLILVQSELGVFIMTEDLRAERIDSFPVREPWNHLVHVDYLTALQTYVVVDRGSGNIHVSSDMREFRKIESPIKVESFVSVLPDGSRSLLVGEDRLFTLGMDCLG